MKESPNPPTPILPMYYFLGQFINKLNGNETERMANGGKWFIRKMYYLKWSQNEHLTI